MFSKRIEKGLSYQVDSCTHNALKTTHSTNSLHWQRVNVGERKEREKSPRTVSQIKMAHTIKDLKKHCTCIRTKTNAWLGFTLVKLVNI